MAGKVICLLVMAGSVLAFLWLFVKKKGKNKQDAAKVMILTGFLGIVLCITEESGQSLTKDGRLVRNKAGEGTASQKLQLDVKGILKDYAYTVEVEARRLKGKEQKKLFADAYEEAEQGFIGENPSLDHIEEEVRLPRSLQNGQIRAKWKFSPEGIINEEGEVDEEKIKEGRTLVMVSLTLTYFEETKNYTFGCQVYPKSLSTAEQLLAGLQVYMEKEQEKSKEEAYFKLPAQINGYILHWSQEQDKTYRIILMLGAIAAIAVYLQQALRDQKKEQIRRNQLLRQYPDMVSKLSLLLGAGMTFSGAWERIVLNYQRQKECHQTEPAEVYEQMLVSYREMQDGMGELKVYERFGERCGTPQYRKLVMLIVQNLRKGSAGLTKILEKEVTEAFALRKNQARKTGEEAGTKILFPMMLMLCVVMIIILVPAFLTLHI